MSQTKKSDELRAFSVWLGDYDEHGITLATSAGKAKANVLRIVAEDQVCSPLPGGGHTPWRHYNITDVRVKRCPEFDLLTSCAKLVARVGRRAVTPEYAIDLLAHA